MKSRIIKNWFFSVKLQFIILVFCPLFNLLIKDLSVIVVNVVDVVVVVLLVLADLIIFISGQKF